MKNQKKVNEIRSYLSEIQKLQDILSNSIIKTVELNPQNINKLTSDFALGYLFAMTERFVLRNMNTSNSFVDRMCGQCFSNFFGQITKGTSASDIDYGKTLYKKSKILLMGENNFDFAQGVTVGTMSSKFNVDNFNKYPIFVKVALFH